MGKIGGKPPKNLLILLWKNGQQNSKKEKK